MGVDFKLLFVGEVNASIIATPTRCFAPPDGLLAAALPPLGRGSHCSQTPMRAPPPPPQASAARLLKV